MSQIDEFFLIEKYFKIKQEKVLSFKNKIHFTTIINIFYSTSKIV